MRLLRLIIQPMRNVTAGQRTVAGEMLRFGLAHAAFHGTDDLARVVVGLVFDAVGTVVARAALDGDHLGVGNQLQDVARLRADFLHALVAGNLPGDLAERLLEVGLEQVVLVAFGQVFERVEEMIAWGTRAR